MSIIRQDPTTKDWVIIATDRGKRPDDFTKTEVAETLPDHDPSCPFCPDNEAMTPLEVLRYPESQKPGWCLRVVPNRFAALGTIAEPYRKEDGPLFREMSGEGYHEVVIETPFHNRGIPQMTIEEVERLLDACQQRYHALKKDPKVKSIILFKNHGERAGTSLVHPHSQIVATPVAPLLIRKKYEVAIGHYDDTGRCLYQDLVDAERSAQVRVLFETDRFVVFHPFASRVPFETWIAPKYQESSFGMVEKEGMAKLAAVLQSTLKGLHTALGDPDFNYIIHSAPTEDETKNYFLWHVQILPRLTTIAGFELGSGMFINTMLPEDCAQFLRDFLGEEPRKC